MSGQVLSSRAASVTSNPSGCQLWPNSAVPSGAVFSYSFSAATPCTSVFTSEKSAPRLSSAQPVKKVCTSTKPGVTTRSPSSSTWVAFSTHSPASARGPTAAMRLPSTATKPSKGASPVAGNTFFESRTRHF